MRFCSPDSWSPFGKGDLNPYCYCEGDPINNIDPSGHAIISLLKKMANRVAKYFWPDFTPPFQENPKLSVEGWLAMKQTPKPVATEISPRESIPISVSTATREFIKATAVKASLEELIKNRAAALQNKQRVTSYSLAPSRSVEEVRDTGRIRDTRR